jgi:hypothetical protein
MTHNLKIPGVFIDDISQQNILVDENFNIKTIDSSNEQMMFDTIVIRRLSGNNYMNLRELQLWVNNSNILPTLIPISNNTLGEELGTTTEFFFNDTKTTNTSYQNFIASNIANNSLSGTYDTHSIDTTGRNTSLYIPLSTFININDIQSFVLYNRTDNNNGQGDRAQGLAIELYNRTIDSTLSTPIISTLEIDVTANIYRFDFPSLYTYNSFISSDSSTNIIDSANSAVYNVLSTNYSSEPVMKFNFKERLFDTIVIRRPTGYSGDEGNHFLNLRELQCWVNNSNILFDNSNSLTPYFSYWYNKNINIGNFNGGSPIHIFDNIIDGDNSIIISPNMDSNISFIIKNIPLININDIQSFVIYNRITSSGRANRAQGLVIELYNESNDPSLNQILASTKIISETADVYRFDFAGIDTYTKGFVDEDSITNIVSSSYATTEITEEKNNNHNRSGFRIENGGLQVDRNLDVSGNLVVGGGLKVDGSLKYDTDAFNYQYNYDGAVTTGNLTFNHVNFGSSILDETYFVAKYSGYYSLTLCLYNTTSSSGFLRIGIKINDSVYYGSSSSYGFFFMSNANATPNDQHCSTIIIPLSKGDKVNPYIERGTLRYWGHHSYFSGYCISLL